MTLSQAMTQREMARQFRVSERSIRRWKNEGVEPNKSLRHIRRAVDVRLQDEFERERKRVTKNLREDRRRHPGAPRIEDKLGILPPGSRRELKEYERGRDTGRTYASDWINYDVSRMTPQDILEVMKAIRDEGKLMQMIYRIPKGARYPRDARGRPGKVVSKSTRTGTPPVDLSNLDDGDLWDFLLRYTDAEPGPKSRRILFVSALAVDPKYPPMNLNEAKKILLTKIAEIKSDERYKYKPALVQINAPLALIQVQMRAEINALTFALHVLRQVKR